MNWYIPSMDVGYIPQHTVGGVMGAAHYTGSPRPTGMVSERVRYQKMCVSTTIFILLGGAMIGEFLFFFLFNFRSIYSF